MLATDLRGESPVHSQGAAWGNCPGPGVCMTQAGAPALLLALSFGASQGPHRDLSFPICNTEIIVSIGLWGSLRYYYTWKGNLLRKMKMLSCDYSENILNACVSESWQLFSIIFFPPFIFIIWKEGNQVEIYMFWLVKSYYLEVNFPRPMDAMRHWSWPICDGPA